MVPHGPGGQMLRAAPRHRYIPPSARAVNRPRSGANLFHPAMRPASPRTQIRQARAQARTYASQGRAVERAANQRNRQQKIARVQKQVRDRAYAQARYYKSQGADIDKRARQGTLPGQSGDRSRDLAKIMRGAPVNKAILGLGGYDKLLKQMNVPAAQRHAAGLAPAIWAVNQVSRPVYGVAGAADAAVRGKSIGQIAKAGGAGRAEGQDQAVLRRPQRQRLEAEVRARQVRARRRRVRARRRAGPDHLRHLRSRLRRRARSSALRRAPLARSAARATQRDLAKKVAEGTLTKSAAKAQAKARAKDIERTVLARGAKAGRTEGHKGLTVSVAGGKHVRSAIRRAGLSSERAHARAAHARDRADPRRGTLQHRRATGKAGQAAADARTLARQMGLSVHGRGARPTI
jgi:hypothetical protein